jgi:hypothetical protein
VSHRVTLVRGSDELSGWALNLSRGGVRAVIDEHLVPGETVDVVIDEIAMRKPGKVAWVQVEPDGAIVGVAFDEPLTEAPPGVELESSIGDGRTVDGEAAAPVELESSVGVPHLPPEPR